MNDTKWSEYYKTTTAKSKPRNTVLKAIELFKQEQILTPKWAIDLGCGAGLDSLALLKSGWNVLSIDSQLDAILNVFVLIPPSFHDKLFTQVASFEALDNLQPSHLINASFSLPFLAPPQFYKFWPVIQTSLDAGGRFSGTFFGERDGWNSRTDMTFLTPEELRHLFGQFEIEFFEEEESVQKDAAGYTKLWHRYGVVAKKKS